DRVAAYDYSVIEVFDTTTGETLLRRDLDSTPDCGGLSFLPDALIYADCENVYVLDFETQTLTTFLTVRGASITGLLAHPDGDLIAVKNTAESDAETFSSVSLYDLKSGEEVFNSGDKSTRMLFDSEGSLLIIVTPNGIEFWGVAP
ncbi:MAG TPA: hypothetical protein VJZ27_07210, partial [Aggregatilineales bacterium]|nr:hypothetical protein [Aggregatilineales bacterium]